MEKQDASQQATKDAFQLQRNVCVGMRRDRDETHLEIAGAARAWDRSKASVLPIGFALAQFQTLRSFLSSIMSPVSSPRPQWKISKTLNRSSGCRVERRSIANDNDDVFSRYPVLVRYQRGTSMYDGRKHLSTSNLEKDRRL